jgi:hypothetical protein
VTWPPIQDNDMPSNRIMTVSEGDILSIWNIKYKTMTEVGISRQLVH